MMINPFPTFSFFFFYPWFIIYIFNIWSIRVEPERALDGHGAGEVSSNEASSLGS